MILVTGGAGFIGSNVAAALAEQGLPVAICDRLRSGAKWRNIGKLELRDIVAPEQIQDWLDEHGAALDAIVHMGAISATTETDADLIVATNFRLSQLLWRWCARHGKRFIYASSAATYGGAEAGFEDDWSMPALAQLRPLNAYGWSKLLFDRWAVREVALGNGQPPQWVGLKFFNVYGPNEYHKGGMMSVVAQKYAAAAAGEPITLFRSHREGISDGGQRRDFVHVSDVARANVLALFAPASVEGPFNIASGQPRTVANLAFGLWEALGRPTEPPAVTGQWRLGDVRHIVASPERAARELGFTAAVPFADGLAELAGVRAVGD